MNQPQIVWELLLLIIVNQPEIVWELLLFIIVNLIKFIVF